MVSIEPRPSQVTIHLDEAGYDRAHFWLPELIEIGTTGERPTFGDDPGHPLSWVPAGEAGVCYELAIPGRLSLTAGIRGDDSGYSLELAIGNLTGHTWQRVHAAACMQLTAAASYLDLPRERTRCIVNGELVSLAEMETIGGKPQYLFAIIAGHVSQARHGDPTRPSAKWCHTIEHPDDGFVCVTSVDGTRTLWTGWEDIQFLQSNATPSYGCIHANPYFGDIGAGEQVVRRGRVAVVEGGPAAARGAFLAAFGADA